MEERAWVRSRLWALNELERLITARGPLVDCHRHLASERTLTPELYAKVGDDRHLSAKWPLMDEIKKDVAYLDGLPDRLEHSLWHMASQGIGFCRTYAEVDSVVGLHVLEAMLEAKKRWQAKGLTLQIAAYPFRGVLDPKERALAENALASADLLGCLPSRGRADVRDVKTNARNMALLFAIVHEQQKPIDLQIDQDNDPEEIESVMLVEAAADMRELGYKAQITATHCTSLAAQHPDLQRNIASRMRSLNISVVVCPTAALSSQQKSDKLASVHNSVAPVKILLSEGVTVGLGTDNVSDIYTHFNNGELKESLRMLLTVIRWTGSLETAADLITMNGRKILGLPRA